MRGPGEDAFMKEVQLEFEKLYGKPQPIPVFTSRPPVQSPSASQRLRVGVLDGTPAAHLRKIGNTWDEESLKELLRELSSEYPTRPELIAAVDQQLIRCELYEFMGSNISTMANIYVDDKLSKTTTARDVKLNDVADVPLERGAAYSKRLIALWNASLYDSEVATIQDVLAWATTLHPEYIPGRRMIRIDIIGTSGPCESCQERLRKMADDLINYFHEQTNVAKDELPPLEVWAIYGNPSKSYKRAGYFVTNGWASDGVQQRLAFTNKAGWKQKVRQHQVLKTGGQGPMDTDPSTFEVPYTS